MNERRQPIGYSPKILLLEEYKIIQGKIDKLGEDKFKVRSWCFTLLTGGAAIAQFSGILSKSWLGLFVFILFIPAIRAFHLVELRQRQIGKRLGSRAQEIESTWRRLQGRNKEEIPTPRLAAHMIREDRAERTHITFREWWKRTFYPEDYSPVKEKRFRATRRRTPTKSGRMTFNEYSIAKADDLFYWMQYLLVAACIVIVAYQNFSGQAKQIIQPSLTMQVGDNEIRFYTIPTNLTVTAARQIQKYAPAVASTNDLPGSK
jgi:hypothetical protein